MAGHLIDGRYQTQRKLISGDPAKGIPDLWEAVDAGDRYFIKTWRRRGDDDAIRALWNREVRGLTRLQGQPGASNRFVRLRQLGIDDRQYYAVLDGGRRDLLSQALAARSTHAWLSNLGEVARRRVIWEGLLRVAEGIGMLHREGTLHRNVSPTAVFVDPEGLGDFRLSGFEWSLRVISSGDRSKPAGGNVLKARELDRDGGQYSIATDWFDFGVLATYVFGASVSRPRTRVALREFVEKPGLLNRSERGLLLGLLAENPEDRIHDSREVAQAIRSLAADLNNVTGAVRRDLVLAVKLGPASMLSEAIDRASSGQARRDEVHKQREWLRQDLRGDVRVIPRSSPAEHFILRGEKLSYKVKPWTRSQTGTHTWGVGFCEAVEPVPDDRPDDLRLSLGARRLDIMALPDVKSSEQRTIDRAATWNRVFSFGKEMNPLPPHLKDTLDFFRVTHQLEVALTIAQICPVRVISFRTDGQLTEVVVEPVAEPTRDDLATNLMLRPPADQLRELLDEGADVFQIDDAESGGKPDTYALLERPVLAREAESAASWSFEKLTRDPKGYRYHFQTRDISRIDRSKVLFLARNHGGTMAQLRRRSRAIDAMRGHEDLLRALTDPLIETRVTDERPPEPQVVLALDESKLAALEQMWRTQPTFAIQGPPGTGKTTLLRGFSDRVLADDASAQLLVTAHSHHTVDDVLDKLKEHFAPLDVGHRPIMLRLGDPTGEFGAVTLAAEALDALAGSELAKNSRKDLSKRLDLARAKRSDGATARPDFRSMQLLMMDAANISLSTSNSGELAELAERGRRFDWSVIEEAGKAHGFDMALALEASHRLVLIGDQEQLPPFNSEVYKDLLAEPLRVSKALRRAARFAPNLIDAALFPEDEVAEALIERCERWRANVDFFARLFDRSRGDERPGPAITLTNQHRMHPDIAEVVGRSFYPDPAMPGGTSLQSPPETHARFSMPPPFAIRSGGWLPCERVVWLDVPWVQKKFVQGETSGVFTSPVEAEAVLDTLGELRSIAGAKCSIQVLSPYNDQLKLIARLAARRFAEGALGHMTEPPFDIRTDKRLGRTVDEFQGSEADVVIVSLVRNNALPPRVSVGFLKHANRMNVLMSRARQKLIVVGSWEFWASRWNESMSPDAEQAYIGRMMGVLSELEGKTVRRIGIHP